MKRNAGKSALTFFCEKTVRQACAELLPACHAKVRNGCEHTYVHEGMGLRDSLRRTLHKK